MAIIRFLNVSKIFGKELVLHNLNLEIGEGEIFGIIGKSGCGKSVLLKTLLGLIPIDFGDIYFRDISLRKNPTFVKKNIGFATQQDTFYDKLTIKENLIYYGKLYGLKTEKIREKEDELLDFFKLKRYKNYLARELSGGTRKRLCLAIALIHDPDVILLDEPTIQLDPLLRQNIWDWIKKVNKAGKTIVVTSHLFEELERNCTQIAVMHNRKIATVGPPTIYRRLFSKCLTFNEIFGLLTENV